MKKVNLLSRAEMRKVMGGTEAVDCVKIGICAFRGPGNQMLNGHCGESENGKQCRCIVIDPITGEPYQSVETQGCYAD